ncbi:MAG: type II secretion system F family protein [Pirellulales bacterium]|nr:type II secretion system F family protein [Pirellulales bacterium]
METLASDLPLRAMLGPADAAELAAGVAELAKACLPLPAGLRALSDELPGRWPKAALGEMAARLERGEALEAVLNASAKNLPLHLHGLLVAGLRSGRLPEVLEEYLQVEQTRRQMCGRLRASLTYLTFLSLAVTVLAFFIEHVYLREMGWLIEQGKGSLSGVFTIASWKLFGQIVWLSAGFSVFLLLMPLSLANFSWMSWLTPATDHLPFVGPLLKNLRLASFSRTAALLLENETPLPDAFRVAGSAAGDVFLARDCRKVAAELEGGRPLDESLHDYWRFPRNLIPLIRWGQQTHALPEAYRVAARLFDGRAKNQSSFIGTIFAPFSFLLIAGFICLAGSVITMPTVATMQASISWQRTSPFTKFAIPPGFAFSSMFSPLLLGVALLVSKRLITLKRDPANENIIETGLSITGWVLIAVGLTGNLLMLMGILAFLWIPVFVVVSIFIALKRRRAAQQALLCTLAVSAERFIPLLPAIEAFAEDARGKFAVRLGKLAAMLKGGVPLPEALRRIKHIVPAQLMPTIRVGYESGALAEGLSTAAAEEDRQHALWGSFAAKMLYIAAMPFFGSAIIMFMLTKILVMYQRIFRDFDTSLPPMTQFMLGVSNWAEACWPLLFAITMIFGLLFFYGIQRYLGVPLFDLPGTGRFLRRQHAAAIMENLALAVEHDRPILDAIRTLGECYPKTSIRKRLEWARFDIERGGPWSECLFRRGLIGKTDLAVLQSAERAGNLPWALREMAAGNRRRLAYQLNVLVQMLFPPAVLCFGAVVLFVVVAMFLPLIPLIRSLS